MLPYKDHIGKVLLVLEGVKVFSAVDGVDVKADNSVSVLENVAEVSLAAVSGTIGVFRNLNIGEPVLDVGECGVDHRSLMLVLVDVHNSELGLLSSERHNDKILFVVEVLLGGDL